MSRFIYFLTANIRKISVISKKIFDFSIKRSQLHTLVLNFIAFFSLFWIIFATFVPIINRKIRKMKRFRTILNLSLLLKIILDREPVRLLCPSERLVKQPGMTIEPSYWLDENERPVPTGRDWLKED